MPKRVDPKKKRRDWRWYASFGMNVLLALSMVLGTVFLFTGAPTRSAAPPPTLEVPTLAPPTLPSNTAPTPAPPTPTPKASVSDYAFAVAGDSRDGDVIYSIEDRVNQVRRTLPLRFAPGSTKVRRTWSAVDFTRS